MLTILSGQLDRCVYKWVSEWVSERSSLSIAAAFTGASSWLFWLWKLPKYSNVRNIRWKWSWFLCSVTGVTTLTSLLAASYLLIHFFYVIHIHPTFELIPYCSSKQRKEEISLVIYNDQSLFSSHLNPPCQHCCMSIVYPVIYLFCHQLKWGTKILVFWKGT